MPSSHASESPSGQALIERRAKPRQQASTGTGAMGWAAAVPGLEVRESSWAEWDDAYEQLSNAGSTGTST